MLLVPIIAAQELDIAEVWLPCMCFYCSDNPYVAHATSIQEGHGTAMQALADKTCSLTSTTVLTEATQTLPAYLVFQLRELRLSGLLLVDCDLGVVNCRHRQAACAATGCIGPIMPALNCRPVIGSAGFMRLNTNNTSGPGNEYKCSPS
jgi:hypothetical protein